MIDAIVNVTALIGALLILLFASIGFMFVWRAFSFATQLSLVEYKYKKLLKASDAAKAKFQNEEDDK